MHASVRAALVSTIGLIGLACAAMGLLPDDVLQAALGRIRRPEDATPERLARARQVALLAGGTFAVLAGWLACYGRTAAAFLSCIFRPNPRPLALPRLYLALAGLAVIVGVGLRLQRLDQPMAYDEAYSYTNFASRSWLVAIADFNSTNNHLLNTFIMHWSARLCGANEWALRLGVFAVGVALIPLTFSWLCDRLGPGPACVAAALAAVAPLLITYSTDARGYMYVALAAVVLDRALGRLGLIPGVPPPLAVPSFGEPGAARCWLQAWAAAVAGGWAMVIIAYHLVGSWLAVLATAPRRNLPDRLRLAAVSACWTVPALVAFYLPAYVFRGLQFMGDPIMVDRPLRDFLSATAGSWLAAFGWWTDDPIPTWIWLLCIFAGVVAAFRPGRGVGLSLLLPFLAVLLMNLMQGVAPPPRVYLSLAPWLYALAGAGSLMLLQPVFGPKAATIALTFVILLVGGVSAARTPVLLDPGERTSYVSVPDVLAEIARQQAATPASRFRLLAPLPTDHPALFYAERHGLKLPINGEPQPGETLWLVTRLDEIPAAALRNMVIRLGGWSDRFAPWQEVATYATLRLYRSTLTPLELDIGLPERGGSE